MVAEEAPDSGLEQNLFLQRFAAVWDIRRTKTSWIFWQHSQETCLRAAVSVVVALLQQLEKGITDPV